MSAPSTLTRREKCAKLRSDCKAGRDPDLREMSMGDSYREELRKTRTGKIAEEMARGLSFARKKAIRRAAVRQKHRAIAWEASHRLATAQTPTQIRMF